MARGMRQRDVASAAGISQPLISKIERGQVANIGLTTVSMHATALGVQLAAFIEAQPGSSLPRDQLHVTAQQLVIQVAAAGGWRGDPEARVREDGHPERFIDVLFTRDAQREAIVTEIWDLVPDVGDAFRGLARKAALAQASLGVEWRVEGLLIVRATSRNRAMVRRLRALFEARFSSSPVAWLRALQRPDSQMPASAGMLWLTVAGDRLVPVRGERRTQERGRPRPVRDPSGGDEGGPGVPGPRGTGEGGV